MFLLVLIAFAFLIFGGGGYYGYRRDYYQGRGLSLVGLILISLVGYGIFSALYATNHL